MNTNLTAIIRNSLAAAQAALDLIQVEQTAAPLVSAAPATTQALSSLNTLCPPVPQNEYQPTGFDRLMQELEDQRYTLRSTRELIEKTGLAHPKTVLDNEGVAFVVKRRRSDGAELIGLAERN